MTKPPSVRLPTWATNVASDIVDPGAPKQDIGWTEDGRPPAQFFNWWKNAVGQYMEYVDRFRGLEYKNWFLSMGDVFFVDRDISGTYGSFQRVLFAPTGGPDGQPQFMSMVDSVDGSNNEFAIMSDDGSGWSAIDLGVDSISTGKAVAFDDTNDIWLLISGDDSFTSADYGRTWTTNTAALPNIYTRDCVWDATNGLFIAITENSASDRTIQTSPDGVTWTERVNDATLGAIPETIVVGGGKIVVTGNNMCFTSADGITWTDRVAFAASERLHKAIYSASAGKWFASGGGGGGLFEVWETTDPDTVAWTSVAAHTWLRPSAEGTSIFIDPDDGTMMAWGSETSGSTGRVQGLLSFDDGVTWEEIRLPNGAAGHGARGMGIGAIPYKVGVNTASASGQRTIMRSLRA